MSDVLQKILASPYAAQWQRGKDKFADIESRRGTANPPSLLEDALAAIYQGIRPSQENLGGLVAAIKPVYHGSPHAFDKFSMDKIGAGEGVQAYGHGLYFADTPGVAESYAYGRPMAGNFKTAEGNDWTPSTLAEMYAEARLRANKGYNKTISYTEEELSGALADRNHEAAQKAQDILKALKSMKKRGIVPNTGNLYEASLRWPDAAREAADPLGPQHFLDWDKPLAQQAQNVQDALARFRGNVNLKDGMPLAGGGKLRIEENPDFGTKYFLEQGGKRFRLSGDDVKNLIGSGMEGKSAYQTAVSELGGDVNASRAWREAGIPGIRYLDGGSRGAGQGTSNYVVFDDNIIEVLKRNGAPIK